MLTEIAVCKILDVLYVGPNRKETFRTIFKILCKQDMMRNVTFLCKNVFLMLTIFNENNKKY